MKTIRLKRECPTCEFSTGLIIHEQAFAESSELGLHSVVNIVSCERCGCGFSGLDVVQEDLDRAYEIHSKYADMSVFGEISGTDPKANETSWDLERLEGTAAWLAEKIPGRDLRILDAGCATGSLIGFLKEFGFTNLVGLDPSPLAAATVQRHYGIPSFAGSFCNPPRNIGKFDLVVLSHVLEHIADIKSAAEGLASIVDDGGLVYLEVPDATRYANFLVAPFHDFNNEHVNHFSIKCLDSLLRCYGFEKVCDGAKKVPIAPNIPYPAIFGLWKKTNTVSRHFDLDINLRLALQDYVSSSGDLLANISRFIEKEIDDEPIALWGAGNLTIKLLASTSLAEKDIRLIVDGSAQRQGLILSGIPVTDPSSLKDFKGSILIMSLHHTQSIMRSARLTLGDGQRLVELNPQSNSLDAS